jgi:hypothetical protein
MPDYYINRVIVHDKPFQPSLMFADMAETGFPYFDQCELGHRLELKKKLFLLSVYFILLKGGVSFN